MSSKISRSMAEIVLPDAAQHLEKIHWNGQGCGTNGTGGCGHCFGPSPMSADDVVADVYDNIAPAIQNETRLDLVSKLNFEKSLHDGPIWKAAIDRCIELINQPEKTDLL